MRAPTSEDDIRRLLEDRPEKTQTHPVDPEIMSRIPLDTGAELRTMNDDEVRELADYLDVGVKELDGPFNVVEANCPHCNRLITFVDFVHTAVKGGAHEQDQLREILTGRAGAWITIRGQDGGRPVVCIGCGQVARMPAYSEYSSSSYAYA
jgi:hypothetical protein